MARTLPRDTNRALQALPPSVRSGLISGAILCGILTAWLFVANRMPSLETFALERNIAAAVAIVIVAALPVCRFLTSPREMLFACGIAWTLVSLCYLLWTLYFQQLANRMGAFHVFVQGMIVYLMSAAAAWLVHLLRSAKVEPAGVHPNHRPLTPR